MPASEPISAPGVIPLVRTERPLLPEMPYISALAASVFLAVLIQAYAGATLRGVYADGAYFATQLAAHRAIFYENLARTLSSVLDQLPVVAAISLGVQTSHGVALVFSLVTNVLPGLFILLCLPALPMGERRFFIFPAFVYFARTLSAQFASVTEGLVATSYFWLLLCLIVFGRLTILRSVMIMLLAAGTVRLHEEMVFLGPLLAASCAMRWPQERSVRSRVVLSVAALCAIISIIIGAHVISSSSTIDNTHHVRTPSRNMGTTLRLRRPLAGGFWPPGQGPSAWRYRASAGASDSG